MTDELQTSDTGLGYLTAIYPQGPPALRVLQMGRREGRDWRQVVGEGGDCHLVWGMGNSLQRAWRLGWLTRQLARQCVGWQLIGLHGSVEQPSVVASLRRNILHYIYTEAFRGTDSPIRALLKWCASNLPAWLTWRGPLVLIASVNPVAFDRFVLLTEGRKIVFMFRAGETAPWAICKRGGPEELAAERRNHERALKLLGDSVPALLKEVDDGALTQEALPERFLGNVVAGALHSRRRVFVREALGHVTFCLSVYRRFVLGAPPVTAAVTEAEVSALVDGLVKLPCAAPAGPQIRAALQGCVGVVLPRLIQHGDFCVRNILIVGGERGRVLIDWEDLQERRWPLADFVLLRLSLKEVYASLFAADLAAMERLPALTEGLLAAEAELMQILSLDPSAMRAAQVLSLACLCRQNLGKGRLDTATAIFGELMTCVRKNLETPAARAAS